MKSEDVPDEMIYAFAGEPEITATDAHAIKAGLAAVMTLVERDYVPRYGWITERVPREFMDTPSMDGFKKQVVEHAKFMGAEVVDIDNPEVLPDESPYTFYDHVVLKWKIRRTA